MSAFKTQSGTANGASVSSLTVTLPDAVHGCNVVIVTVAVSTATPRTTLVSLDGVALTSLKKTDNGAGATLETFWLDDAAGGGTVTVTFSGAVDNAVALVSEWNGIAPQSDRAVGDYGGSGDPASGTFTTRQDGEFLYGAAATLGSETLTPESGWTARGSDASGTAIAASEQTGSGDTAGDYNATWTGGGAIAWLAQAISLSEFSTTSDALADSYADAFDGSNTWGLGPGDQTDDSQPSTCLPPAGTVQTTNTLICNFDAGHFASRATAGATAVTITFDAMSGQFHGTPGSIVSVVASIGGAGNLVASPVQLTDGNAWGTYSYKFCGGVSGDDLNGAWNVKLILSTAGDTDGSSVNVANVRASADYYTPLGSTFDEFGSGGLSLGGSAFSPEIIQQATTGSLTLGGNASPIGPQNITATGGLTLSGQVASGNVIDQGAGGSLTATGSGLPQANANLTGDGSLALSGEGSLVRTYDEEGDGGLETAGEADPGQEFAPITADGGLALAGEVFPSPWPYTDVGSGGLTAAGSADPPLIVWQTDGSGGVQATGQAGPIEQAFAVITASGSLAVGGTTGGRVWNDASQGGLFVLAGTGLEVVATQVTAGLGGLQTAGSAKPNLRVAFAMTSGAAMAGVAPIATVARTVGGGGLTASGGAAGSNDHGVQPAGGLTARGNALLATETTPSLTGGVTAGGAARLAVRTKPLATGGVTAGGGALNSTDANVTAHGGLRASGAAAAPTLYVSAGLGGLTAGGAALPHLALHLAGSGGLATTGVAGFTGDSLFVMRGGVALGGAATHREIFAPAIASGLALGGIGRVATVNPLTGSGGLAAEGAAAFHAAFRPHAGGSVSLAGSAPPAVGLATTATGGGLHVAGASHPSATFHLDVGGALDVSGAARLGLGASLTSSGGLALDGDAAPTLNAEEQGHAGVSLFGRAVAPADYASTSDGGLALSGQAKLRAGFVDVSGGGLSLAGMAATPAVYVSAATGGLHVAGHAPNPWDSTNPGTGALVAGGMAQQHADWQPLPEGGLSVGGSAPEYPAWGVTARGSLLVGGSASPQWATNETAAGGLNLTLASVVQASRAGVIWVDSAQVRRSGRFGGAKVTWV